MTRPKDQFQRPLRDLRISVTDKCNFRCAYCMPREIFGPDHPFLPKGQILSYEEIALLVRSFRQLGVEKVRITGGEPLLRKDLPQLIEMLCQESPELDISLTTNGSLLDRFATSLKEAGLERINISLDSIDPVTCEQMSGGKSTPSDILRGIDSAIAAGLATKVNMVVKRGTNDSEILQMFDTFLERQASLRYIEYMDVGNSNKWKLDEVVPSKEILDTISSKYEVEAVRPNYVGEVANRYRVKNTTCEFGIISSVSKPFCANCNRARISADGKLYTCLFAEDGFDIKSRLREGISEEELTNFVSNIWTHRKDRYSEERSISGESKPSRKKIEMSYIGG